MRRLARPFAPVHSGGVRAGRTSQGRRLQHSYAATLSTLRYAAEKDREAAGGRLTQHQIAPPDLRDEFAADGLVLGGGGVQRVGDDGAGEEVGGEVDLHPGGRTVVIAVGGKVPSVGLGNHLQLFPR